MNVAAATATKRLVLPVKEKWFRQIQSGEKPFEFRLRNDYWTRRLVGQSFSEVVITLGYPKRTDLSRRLTFPWRGFEETTITSPEWDNVPQDVFAIRLAGASGPQIWHKSPWGSRRELGLVEVFPLKRKFGQGERVLISFYAAPECIIVVDIADDLPLDLPLEERCRTHTGAPRSLRDLLPEIYAAMQEQWEQPPGIEGYRYDELIKHLDDEAELWGAVMDEGSTWQWF